MFLDKEFTHIKWINLAHREDRKEHMEKELARVGIEAKRFPAIKTEDHRWKHQRIQKMWYRTPGAIGCWYSQAHVMAEAYQLSLNAFVMEDDLVFCSDFKERLEYMERFVEGKEWDVIWLGGTVHTDKPYWHKPGHRDEIKCSCNLNRDFDFTADPRVIRTYGAFSTHAYIVNKDSILKILEELDRVINHSIGIDAAFIELAPTLNCFMYVPGMVKQMDNKSDIGRGITEFSLFSKLGPYWWQNKKEDFDPLNYNWNQ